LFRNSSFYSFFFKSFPFSCLESSSFKKQNPESLKQLLRNKSNKTEKTIPIANENQNQSHENGNNDDYNDDDADDESEIASEIAEEENEAAIIVDDSPKPVENRTASSSTTSQHVIKQKYKSKPIPISPSRINIKPITTAGDNLNFSDNVTAKIKSKNEILLSLQPPPKLKGWLKKRGHLLLNWKTRYFVLDNGFLTYYMDSLEIPPYGKNVKGQICLAGYREKKESQFEQPFGHGHPQQKTMEVEASVDYLKRENTLSITQDRDSSKTNIIHVDYLKNNMIHLEFVPGLVKEDVSSPSKHNYYCFVVVFYSSFH
jgi:hypothetical protein